MGKQIKNEKIEMSDKEKQEMQQLYMQYEIMKQYSAVYTQENNAIDAKLEEIGVTMEAVRELPKMKKGNEFLTNLGSQVFMSAGITEHDKIIIELGSGVFGKKTTEEALVMLEKRKNELEKTSNQIMMELTSLNMQLKHLEPQLQEMMQRAQ
ncbi:MAG: prefoldin subunit alpha [Candidatus Aenigmatarchaeota archaeon]